MRNIKNSTRVEYSMKAGFSLVEIIIAIAMLAILVVPMFAYFTNAALNSSQGKNTHKANMAAQTALEDVESCETFEQIEEKLTSASGSSVGATWEVDSAYDSTNKRTVLKKDITVDGSTYHTVMTIDYKGDGGVYKQAYSDRFNEFDEPELSSVYSENNLVFSDSTDVESEALSEFLYSHRSQSIATIKASPDFKRTLGIHIEKSGSLYVMTAYYDYTYDGESYRGYLGNKSIQINKLKNVYIFYKFRDGHKDEDENVFVDIDNTITDASGINMYFICQEASTAGLGSSYYLNVTGSGVFDNLTYKPVYYTNVFDGSGNPKVKPTGLTSMRSLTGSRFSDTDNIKRIAKITVDVYNPTNLSDRLVRLETSKGD